MDSLVSWMEQHMGTCANKALTGFDCPGCGMQRSFIELLKGNLGESLHLYPALLPTIFTIIFTGLHIAFGFRNGATIIKYSFIATTGIAIVSYILKMTL